MKELLKALSRPLDVSEIEFRVQSVKSKGGILLAYKTARTDMNILDESGLMWQNDYKTIDGKLFCGIGVYIQELDQWIWKWDTGTESNSDAQKGEASDAFKRAGFRWGIGRELYDFPFIWVNKRDDKDEFKDVKQWTWFINRTPQGDLLHLSAKDKTGKTVYSFGKTFQEEPKAPLIREVKKELKALNQKGEKPLLLEGSDNFNKCVIALNGGFTLVDLEKKYKITDSVRTKTK